MLALEEGEGKKARKHRHCQEKRAAPPPPSNCLDTSPRFCLSPLEETGTAYAAGHAIKCPYCSTEAAEAATLGDLAALLCAAAGSGFRVARHASTSTRTRTVPCRPWLRTVFLEHRLAHCSLDQRPVVRAIAGPGRRALRCAATARSQAKARWWWQAVHYYFPWSQHQHCLRPARVSGSRGWVRNLMLIRILV